MPLESQLFENDSLLNACLVDDSAHVTPGASGEHVAKIQLALFMIDGLAIDPSEIDSQLYGPSTAATVLAYKTTRNILGPGQITPDDIVGKQTIAALDDQLVAKQSTLGGTLQDYCGNDTSENIV
jgi:peptidoglycan hydrolase-like protein with peptidoglycan-binding domain